jgi:accessory colonization factor AcfC
LQSKDESGIADEWIHWDDHPQTIEDIQAMLQRAKEAALKRENALAHAFSHQVLPSFV